MNGQFQQLDWGSEVAESATELIRLAVAEDLGGQRDWTTAMLVPDGAPGSVDVVARQDGVVAGLKVVELLIEQLASDVRLTLSSQDGDQVAPGRVLANLTGSAADILTAERVLLNFLGRLSGVATLTRTYVDAVVGAKAEVYDTRKTTPGWRLLEKYAVRCGGGQNHRLGLNRAVMIKDNHVALASQQGLTLAEATEKVRSRLADQQIAVEAIEVEVDTLEQFAQVLPTQPDIVLLDNMTNDHLRAAVELRDASAPQMLLEASGGVSLATIGAIAKTGVDRISVGALTHSAPCLDIGLDWHDSGR
ncbi:carboxylating nicotinate-nucleotide diphosphorylase [Aeoliella mucimassa]|uniref:Probable nicotinate-nucleotide pyrophosphorylase [carboxylating] n=1 Tax=Aeoliella mucimassa TaxID=2527972 RepID=A0A518AKY5_9BACT|nr:carboxylating nicotinate-nucleotide diphosphorylase [Aeoliella mucimassa]QDU55393.1 Nicotinate-nucleotide pyrophosphorylase [carboxylating] [Aeoliella mucimassa]